MAITRQDLANYNGKNGSPAYIAYNGRVWDVSKVFVNGQYAGFEAGTDLTNQIEFDSSILQNGIIIGGLSD